MRQRQLIAAILILVAASACGRGIPKPSPTNAPGAPAAAEPSVSPAPVVDPVPQPVFTPLSEPSASPSAGPSTEPSPEPTVAPTPPPRPSPSLRPKPTPSASPSHKPTPVASQPPSFTYAATELQIDGISFLAANAAESARLTDAIQKSADPEQKLAAQTTIQQIRNRMQMRAHRLCAFLAHAEAAAFAEEDLHLIAAGQPLSLLEVSFSAQSTILTELQFGAAAAPVAFQGLVCIGGKKLTSATEASVLRNAERRVAAGE